MKALHIQGLVAATATPMHEDGSIRLDAIAPQVDFLVDRGIKGLYILGSTGEGVSLTDRERDAVTEAFVKAVDGRIKIFVQVGHNSWQAAAELAAHAEALGVDAISATPPGYFKPDNADELIDGLSIVTRAASKTPFYYYHIPFFSGISMDMGDFVSKATDRLDTFVGVKYSDGATLYNLQNMQEASPQCEFLAGSDESFLMSCAQGYKGFVGSTYGYAAPIYRKVQECFESGNLDEARHYQNRALRLINILLGSCGRAGLKAMWKFVGVDCGPVRSPIHQATSAQIAELERRLKEAGYDSLCVNK